MQNTKRDISRNVHLFCPYMKVNRVQNNITEWKQNKTKHWDIFRHFLLCFITEEIGIRVCIDIRVSKCWQNFHFWENYPFNNFLFLGKLSQVSRVWIPQGSINITSVSWFTIRELWLDDVNVEHCQNNNACCMSNNSMNKVTPCYNITIPVTIHTHQA